MENREGDEEHSCTDVQRRNNPGRGKEQQMQGRRQRAWVRVETSEEEALVLGWNVGRGNEGHGEHASLDFG